MISNPRRTIAIKLTLALLVFLAPIFPAWGAEPAGTVTHLSGPLMVKKADGSVRALYINSAVEEGDVLITEKRTYARLKMRDNSDITLRPNAHFKIEQFTFNKDRPGEDRSFYNLTKGGMRTVTGLIGKRGNMDGYRLTTPTAVAGIRGTGFGATFCNQDCGSAARRSLYRGFRGRDHRLQQGGVADLHRGTVRICVGAGQRAGTAARRA